MAFHKSQIGSIDILIKKLERHGINTVLRQNDTGRVYGITYVDHVKKTVFNGSDLGKNYSAQGIETRCGLNLKSDTKPKHLSQDETWDTFESKANLKEITMTEKITENLFSSSCASDYLPYQFKKKKRRKRQKKL